MTKDIKKDQTYSLSEALEVLKKSSYTKFDATCEAHLNLLSREVRGTVNLPHGTGKTQKILAFALPSSSRQDKPLPQNANITIGGEEEIEKIVSGKLVAGRDFNLVLATPEFMPKLAKVAKILGPRGLMPSPKAGTIVDDMAKGLAEFSSGRVEFKAEANAPVVHLAFGKVSWDSAKLKENLETLISAIGKNKIQKLTLSSTMGPGIKVDSASF